MFGIIQTEYFINTVTDKIYRAKTLECLPPHFSESYELVLKRGITERKLTSLGPRWTRLIILALSGCLWHPFIFSGNPWLGRRGLTSLGRHLVFKLFLPKISAESNKDRKCEGWRHKFFLADRIWNPTAFGRGCSRWRHHCKLGGLSGLNWIDSSLKCLQNFSLGKLLQQFSFLVLVWPKQNVLPMLWKANFWEQERSVKNS